MCGIIGLYRPDSPVADNLRLVEHAVRTMTYRGPDGNWSYGAGAGALAMSRLSIIDVVGSNQPLFNESHNIAMVCNGEIYNYRELRKQLLARGHRFSTDGDCEVIVHLYEDFGPDFVNHLRGMFAIALFDERDQTLLVARDRLGIKLLYWAHNGRAHVFASEIRAIVAAGFAQPELAPDIALGYLRNTFSVHSRLSLLKGVARVEPGTIVRLTSSGASVDRYWSEPTPHSAGSVEEVFHTLEEAVNIHQYSDVPAAVLLSGGLDSSVLAALSRSYSPLPKLVTAGYAGATYEDESQAAQVFARLLGSEAERITVTDNDIIEGFEQMSLRIDEPAADPSSVVQWLLYRRAASMGCRVVHTGIGGDEVFGGYTLWNQLGAALEFPKGVPLLETLVAKLVERLIAVDRPGSSGEEGLLGYLPLAVSRGRILQRLRPSYSRSYRCGCVSSTTSWNDCDAVYRVLRRLYLANNGFLLGDKIGMAASVEVRVPLADHLLLERVLSLPVESRRANGGFAKPILRAMLYRQTGTGWETRKKRGFEVPMRLLQHIVTSHIDLLFQSPTANALFESAPWKASLESFRRLARATDASRKQDRLRRYAWILGATPKPDMWGLTTLLFGVLCIDRAIQYWSTPPAPGLAA
jgi:asparagine synthase (glutamine-hydrolysing)